LFDALNTAAKEITLERARLRWVGALAGIFRPAAQVNSNGAVY
jgi:hypothetical protein